MPPVTIGPKPVDDPRQPFVIAEMAWAHDGSVEKALQIVDDTASAGADALNVHLTHMPAYMIRQYGSGPGRASATGSAQPIFDYLSEVALGPADWESVAGRVRQRGLLLTTLCNDLPSLELADRLGPDAHVLAPAVIGDAAFVRGVAARGLPVIVSIGGSTLGEIESTIALCVSGGASGVVVQYGYQAYPTRPADLDLGYIRTLRDTFGWPVGYHDHTDAEDPLAYSLPLLALGAGATVLEKHATHDRAARGEDFESALAGDELRRFVELVRDAALALGDGRWRPLNEAELAYRNVVRKRAVAARDLVPGDELTRSSVAFKRADDGILATEFPFIEGRRLRRGLAADGPIEWSDIG